MDVGQDMEVVPAALEAPKHLPERAQTHGEGKKILSACSEKEGNLNSVES